MGVPGRHPLCLSYLGGDTSYGGHGGGGGDCYYSACSGDREGEGEK